MNLSLYRILSLALYPLIILYLIVRLLKGKEDFSRIGERFGYPSIKRDEGALIWVHAASVGEIFAILPILKQMNQSYPDAKILVTSGTVTSANLAKNLLPKNCFHQFSVVDSPVSVKRFLKYWRPYLVIFTESEFWPNSIIESSKIAKLVLVNGRISDKSFKIWKKYPKFIKSMLEVFSLILTQSTQDNDRFKVLGAKNATYTGNLKYVSSAPKADLKELKKLKEATKGRLVFMAASTHDDEELRIAELYKKLKLNHKSLLLIISPRHPHRAEKIISKLKKETDLDISCRSLQQQISENTDIYIADTMGEYGIFYTLSNIVFIGGSLIRHGGQNLLEPARLNNVILMGPHMYNFKEITDSFVNANAAIQVSSDSELEMMMDNLLRDKKLQKEMIANAKMQVSNVDNILHLNMDKIKSYIIVD